MAIPVDIGDMVEIYGKDERRNKGIVVHMPVDTGDLLYINAEGIIYGYNTGASDFLCLKKVSE